MRLDFPLDAVHEIIDEPIRPHFRHIPIPRTPAWAARVVEQPDTWEYNHLTNWKQRPEPLCPIHEISLN
jgi:hypothetical protein